MISHASVCADRCGHIFWFPTSYALRAGVRAHLENMSYAGRGGTRKSVRICPQANSLPKR
jgi:hypothetical protein